MRGYAFESLGVTEGDAVVPGRYYAVASVEATRWIDENWGLATFVDAGNAVDSLLGLRTSRSATASARALRTPIGPFRLDVAYGSRTCARCACTFPWVSRSERRRGRSERRSARTRRAAARMARAVHPVQLAAVAALLVVASVGSIAVFARRPTTGCRT